MTTGSRSGARSIMLLVHALPPDEHTGATLTAHGYARELARRGWDVTVVHGSADPDPGWAGGHPKRHRRTGEDFFRVPAPRTPWLGAQWARRAAAFPADPARTRSDAALLALLVELDPTVVHVVDNVDLPLSWPELAAATGVPVIRTVTCAEDLCGLIAPVSPCSGPRGYCAAPLTPAHCAGCVLAAMRATPGPCHPALSGSSADGGTARATADRWLHDELVERLTVKREAGPPPVPARLRHGGLRLTGLSWRTSRRPCRSIPTRWPSSRWASTRSACRRCRRRQRAGTTARSAS